MSYNFEITIGPKYNTVIVQNNKPAHVVQDAYYNACELVPEEWWPENIFSEYEENGLSENDYVQFVKYYGEDMLEYHKSSSTPWQCWAAEHFAEIIIKFLLIGNKDLELRVRTFENLQPKKRGNNFGYGLML